MSAERAVELRAQGMSLVKVAAALGVSKNTVLRWTNPDYAEKSRIRARDAKRRRTGTCEVCGTTTRYGGHKPAVSARCGSCSQRRVDRDLIIGLRKQGLSQTAIAQRAGCSQTHVSEVLRANGLGVGRGSGPGRGPRPV